MKELKLSVNNLKISFRTDDGTVQAVRGINFDLYKGETLALVGESGSGKSVTNRAIMGILAANAIKESGEIIYDGQDLMKLEEEDFHKLRGDKIAMIFQDPMSSLNPIMRVGKQMTEATLIKGKVSQKQSKEIFNKTLALLNKRMDEARGNEQENKAYCKMFDDFEYKHLELEYSYNKAREALENAIGDIKDVLFRIEKRAFDNVRRDLAEILKETAHTIERYVVYARADELKGLLAELKTLSRITLVEKAGGAARFLLNKKQKKDNAQVAEWDQITKKLEQVLDILNEADGYVKPNFFAMGYYAKFAKEPLPQMEIEELNKFLRNYLDEKFMLYFISIAKEGVLYSNKLSIEAKKQAIQLIDEKLPFFDGDSPPKTSTTELCKELISAVEKCIDKLDVIKDNVLYTFSSSLKTSVNRYFEAIIHNVQEEKRFERQTAKYNSLVKRGKTPDYTVAEKDLVDLKVAKQDVVNCILRVKQKMQKDIENNDSIDFDAKVVSLIDFFKEKASAVVFKVTKAIAKNRALKLLEEVGIPEPRKRFRQYPFEFSGGMRQRIVIAIALSANPDILICDEPTTALDVTIQSQILELINKVKRERNLTVIFITHDLGVVANMADRVAVMYAGKIVEIGTAEDVFYNPKHPYTWALLSSMPDLDTKEKLEAIPGTPPNMIYPPKGDAFAERNKYALKIDFEEEPPMFKVSDTHYAATWLLHPSAPKVDPPKQVLDRITKMKKMQEEMLNG